MPANDFSKKRLKARVDALDDIRTRLPPFWGAGFGGCSIFSDSVDGAPERVYSAILTHTSPCEFLRSVSLIMKREFSVLKLEDWMESVEREDPLTKATDRAIEACSDFRDWYTRARLCVENDLVTRYRTEGETPLGKGLVKILELRFRSRWDEKVQEEEKTQDSRSIMERFKEFLS